MTIFLRCCFSAIAWFAMAAVAQANLSCAPHSGYNAADFSQSLLMLNGPKKSDGFKALKSIGIKTVIRYYDYSDEGLFCKTLTPPETRAILNAGLSIITVFQSGGHDPENFINENPGAKHVERAVELAKANGQPAGSAIYFAVDGVDQRIKDLAFEYSMSDGKSVSAKRKRKLSRADRTLGLHFRFYSRYLKYHRSVFRKKGSDVAASDIMPFVARYFSAIKKQMNTLPAGERYKIGVYGSGQTCQYMRKRGLADYCWLAMARNWPGTKSVLKSGSWHVDQALPSRCSSWRFRQVEKVTFDFNRVKGNAGQWSRQVRPSGTPSAQAMCSNQGLQSYFNKSVTSVVATVVPKFVPAKSVEVKAIAKPNEKLVVEKPTAKKTTLVKPKAVVAQPALKTKVEKSEPKKVVSAKPVKKLKVKKKLAAVNTPLPAKPKPKPKT